MKADVGSAVLAPAAHQRAHGHLSIFRSRIADALYDQILLAILSALRGGAPDAGCGSTLPDPQP